MDVDKNGALAVNEGRDVAPLINSLLSLPFVAKIATQDWHPADHISFASNHADKQPFVDFATVVNPDNASESYSTRLWPVHCVQNTTGAELIPELEADKVETVIKKGTDPRVEMYSAFYDPFEAPRVSDSGLAGVLKEKGVTHVYVVGLAFDYCVKCTAMDAAKEGFTTYVVEEGTRAVDAPKWEECKAELQQKGVVVVSADGPEVAKLKG
ncbi:putative pyrazinamidase nicotinamidase protein [Phaeoacremonium minimum UCRPA7]|uniref:nicotinamidase n=1 Tax=Phaeoacremonium minimum (strain UCR-PA7) TaxID=1286976 RepID=R8B9R8_PHAM7|nr:putative pyrazinamidase nicotinamidase protein [Phaeoacremonium minimum UCRPA7]EON96027.1 putative pyrazinamidase nicotinamidase protein [Phaeoacremonium minimum UCRPA7]